uniref:Uncharacterized protein n=1 Tax=Erpetoichthys calabaricus TaxID=27687 RepID=A0A8C4XHC8_ERPCA
QPHIYISMRLTGLTFHRTHLLSALLSPLLLLALSACEAGLGLSLLVATSHAQSGDPNRLNLAKGGRFSAEVKTAGLDNTFKEWEEQV